MFGGRSHRSILTENRCVAAGALHVVAPCWACQHYVDHWPARLCEPAQRPRRLLTMFAVDAEVSGLAGGLCSSCTLCSAAASIGVLNRSLTRGMGAELCGLLSDETLACAAEVSGIAWSVAGLPVGAAFGADMLPSTRVSDALFIGFADASWIDGAISASAAPFAVGEFRTGAASSAVGSDGIVDCGTGVA